MRFLAVYEGRTISEASLLCVSTDSRVVERFFDSVADERLGEEVCASGPELSILRGRDDAEEDE